MTFDEAIEKLIEIRAHAAAVNPEWAEAVDFALAALRALVTVAPDLADDGAAGR
jgi:hypothetical protein